MAETVTDQNAGTLQQISICLSCGFLDYLWQLILFHPGIRSTDTGGVYSGKAATVHGDICNHSQSYFKF